MSESIREMATRRKRPTIPCCLTCGVSDEGRHLERRFIRHGREWEETAWHCRACGAFTTTYRLCWELMSILPDSSKAEWREL